MPAYEPVPHRLEIERDDLVKLIGINDRAAGDTHEQQILSALIGAVGHNGWDQHLHLYAIDTVTNHINLSQHADLSDAQLLAFPVERHGTNEQDTPYHELACADGKGLHAVVIIGEGWTQTMTGRTETRYAVLCDANGHVKQAAQLRGDARTTFHYEDTPGGPIVASLTAAVCGPLPERVPRQVLTEWLTTVINVDGAYVVDIITHPQFIGALHTLIDDYRKQPLPAHLSNIIPVLKKSAADITITDTLVDWIGGPLQLRWSTIYQPEPARRHTIVNDLLRAELLLYPDISPDVQPVARAAQAFARAATDTVNDANIEQALEQARARHSQLETNISRLTEDELKELRHVGSIASMLEMRAGDLRQLSNMTLQTPPVLEQDIDEHLDMWGALILDKNTRKKHTRALRNALLTYLKTTPALDIPEEQWTVRTRVVKQLLDEHQL